KKIDFWNFDVYEFDAGLDFFRDGRTVKRLKQMGKKIIVAYTGSDFRTRGVIRPVDELADLRITFEWDHLDLDPTLVHCLFPFEPERFAFRLREPGPTWRIGHAPTHRAAKGSDQILAVLQSLQASHPVEVVLIENLPHPQALALKETCDIFIDQIGDLGYGINALEAIAMGIPTCTSLVPAFKAAYPDHPFVEVNADNLQQQLLFLMAHADRRLALSRKGRTWVESVHDSRKIVQKIHRLLAGRPAHEAPQLG
ncbi:MAG: glycosyltransferase family 1 protein, partial [Calditrichaeota bacterium]